MQEIQEIKTEKQATSFKEKVKSMHGSEEFVENLEKNIQLSQEYPADQTRKFSVLLFSLKLDILGTKSAVVKWLKENLSTKPASDFLDSAFPGFPTKYIPDSTKDKMKEVKKTLKEVKLLKQLLDFIILALYYLDYVKAWLYILGFKH